MSHARRILYVDHTAVLAGGEIALLNLVRNLDRRRYTPTVLLLAEGPLAAALRGANIETKILPAGRAMLHARKDSIGLKSFAAAGAVAKAIVDIRGAIDQSGADLVHTNSLKSNILGGLAARGARRPVLWHIRDRIARDYLSPAATCLVRTMANLVPDHVVANSNATLDTVHLQSPGRGSVVYSGLDLSQFLKIVPKPSGPFRVGMVGRLTKWKGQHVFLNAAAKVLARHPATRFQIVGGPLFGETDYEKSLFEQARSLGIASAVEFTGHRENVAELLADMDAVVHASITPEPFGQVIVLAMAAGKPVIATRGGGVPEIIADGCNGLLVPMGDAPAISDAIIRVIENPDLAARLGAAGRQRARENFTIEKTAARMMDLYDRL